MSSTDQIPSHNGLKALVIGLGILIVVGVTVLIGGIFWRLSEARELSTTTQDLDLTLPQGAVIEESDVADGTLVLRLSFPGDPGREEILIVDHVTGHIKSRIDVRREP